MRRIGCALALAMGLSLYAPAMPALADDTVTDAVEQTVATDTVEGAQDTGATDQVPETTNDSDTMSAVVDEQGMGDVPASVATDEVASEDPATIDAGASTDELVAAAAGAEPSVEEDTSADAEAAAAEAGEGQAAAPEPGEAAAGPAERQAAGAAPRQAAALATQGAEDGAGGPAAEEPVVRGGDVFTLAPAGARSPRVAVAGNSKASGANVELARAKTLLGEYWRAFALPGGAWRIVNLAGSKSLAVEGSPRAGSNVSVSSGAGTGWLIERNADGTVCVIPLGHESLRLALAGGKTAAGTNLLLARAKASSPAQRFSLGVAGPLTAAVSAGARVDADIVVAASAADRTKALCVAGASRADGANVQLGAKSSSLSRKLVLRRVRCNLYTLQVASSGKFLECEGGRSSAGTNVCQGADSSGLAQLWYFVRQPDGTYSIRSAKSGLALGVRAAQGYDGANVEVQRADGSDRQGFVVRATSLYPNGRVLRLSPSSAPSAVVAVASNRASSGANVQLGSRGYLLGQWWRVASSRGLSFRLVSMRSGYALGVGGELANNANVNVSRAGTAWVARVNDGGTLTLSPSGKASLVLEVEKGGKAVGSNVRVRRSGGAAAQRFEAVYNQWLTAAVTEGLREDAASYNIASALGGGLVADVAGGSAESGANVRLAGASGADAQKWYLEGAGSGLYRLRCAQSGMSLGVAGRGRKSGSNVAHLKSDDTLFQLWYLTGSANGCVVRSAASGLALDVDGGRAASGANIEVNKASGARSQTWVLEEKPLVEDGSYCIAWSICNPLVLSVASGSKDPGANVNVNIANGTAAQTFVFRRLSDGTYTIKNKKSRLYLQVEDASKSNGANVEQGKGTPAKAARWRLIVSPHGGLSIKNVNSGKYLEVADGQIRLNTNVRQSSTYKSLAQSFVALEAGYKPTVGKIGWQNPAGYPQVSRYSVKLPSYAKGSHTYVSPSVIRVDATRDECIEAFIKRAHQYLGTRFNEPWSTQPGGSGVDCSGLVLQCLYATGMDLEHAAGTGSVGGYNPYNHYYVPRQTYNSARWYESGTFKRVSKSSMRRGDLIFYGYYGDNGPVVYHVAIYLGNGKIIHSTNYAGSGNKVRIDNKYVSLYQTIIGVERPFV